MLDGDTLWNASVTRGMSVVHAHGRDVSVFADAPVTPYTSLASTAARTPDAVALVSDEGRPVTFAQLRVLVDQFAAFLTGSVGAGDRVALLVDTSIEFAVAFYAANRLGATVVPVPTKHKEPEIEALLALSQPALVIAEESFADLRCLRDAPRPTIPVGDRAGGYGFRDLPVAEFPTADPPSADPDADCILMYTSGTTARSKGVLLTNRNVGHAIAVYRRVLDLDETDSSIIPVPIYHITGLVALLGLFVHIGGRLHLHRRFDAVRVLRTVHEERITFLHASPTVFSLLLKEASGFPSLPNLRMLACGAAHMPVSRIRALHRWLPTTEFRTIYGLTETTSPGFVFPGDAATSVHCGSSGRPVPGLRVAIRGNDGSELPVGERGEIWLQGTNILRRYDNLETTALTADGWLNTQDVGYVNDDGYVFIVDRSKDMINRGGEKVWCIDVEEELRRLDTISDAAVVGVAHEVYGEEPAALLVPASGSALDLEDVERRLSERLARFQVPRRFLVRAAIPMTANFKVDKNAVRAMFDSEDQTP